MKITRKWEMPNSNTFEVSCIESFVKKHLRGEIISIDPFANKNKIAKITNDLDPEFNCDYNLDAKDFLGIFQNESVDIVLFDPPYSPRQISECYKKFGRSVNMETTQASFWSNLKDEISRIVRPGGKCLSFGWNTNGIGKNRGFEINEILLVAHGGAHNDTICMCETKFTIQLFK